MPSQTARLIEAYARTSDGHVSSVNAEDVPTGSGPLTHSLLEGVQRACTPCAEKRSRCNTQRNIEHKTTTKDRRKIELLTGTSSQGKKLSQFVQ